MDLFKILIYIHAAAGGVALIGGMAAAIAKKGSSKHKQGGRIFFYSLLFSASLSLIIASLPSHHNPFLLAIAIFTLYLILGGNRAIKNKTAAFDVYDKIISLVMCSAGLGMIIIPLLFYSKINVVLTVFGGIGLVMTFQDFKLFSNKNISHLTFKKMHISKMTGGFIAAVTAFVVVNKILPGMVGWIAPSIIGTVFIVFHIQKVNEKRKNIEG